MVDTFRKSTPMYNRDLFSLSHGKLSMHQIHETRDLHSSITAEYDITSKRFRL